MKDTKVTNKKNIITGAVTGFIVGAAVALVPLSSILSKLPLRSIIVACVVSGLGWAVAGGLFGYGRSKKAE